MGWRVLGRSGTHQPDQNGGCRLWTADHPVGVWNIKNRWNVVVFVSICCNDNLLQSIIIWFAGELPSVIRLLMHLTDAAGYGLLGIQGHLNWLRVRLHAETVHGDDWLSELESYLNNYSVSVSLLDSLFNLWSRINHFTPNGSWTSVFESRFNFASASNTQISKSNILQ